MKTVTYTRRAADALNAHSNRAKLIMSKIRTYADNPASQSANVKAMQGSDAFRLRVGKFRVIFEETDTQIIILDIGPRGGIYD